MGRGGGQSAGVGRVDRIGTLVGMRVFNLDEEEVGRIESVMLDVELGQASYAVLSFGPLAGMGDRLFPIPWKLLHLDPERPRCILALRRDRLKTAPGFAREDWPRMADREWASEIHSFYGEPPYWAQGPADRRGPQPGRRASDRTF